MVKLNERKVRWTIREMEKGEPHSQHTEGGEAVGQTLVLPCGRTSCHTDTIPSTHETAHRTQQSAPHRAALQREVGSRYMLHDLGVQLAGAVVAVEPRSGLTEWGLTAGVET